MKKALIILCVIFVGLGTIFMLSNTEPAAPSKPYYTNIVGDWVSNVDNFQVSDKVVVDVDRMTRGDSLVDEKHQRYVVNGDVMSFYYSGFYNGIEFKTEYKEDEFYIEAIGKSEKEIEELNKNYTKIRIANDMKSGDGIIEGIVVARNEKGGFVMYVFVDEDWKNMIESTNIIWGNEFTDINSLNLKKFDFTKNVDGVYVNKITENLNWFESNPIKGGMIVGDMTKQDVVDYNINRTLMIIR